MFTGLCMSLRLCVFVGDGTQIVVQRIKKRGILDLDMSHDDWGRAG